MVNQINKFSMWLPKAFPLLLSSAIGIKRHVHVNKLFSLPDNWLRFYFIIRQLPPSILEGLKTSDLKKVNW